MSLAEHAARISPKASTRVADAAALLSPDEEGRQFSELLAIAPNAFEQGRENMRKAIGAQRRIRVSAQSPLIWC